MPRIRVHSLAKEFNMNSKELLALLHDMGISATSHNSVLSNNEVEAARSKLAKSNGMANSIPCQRDDNAENPPGSNLATQSWIDDVKLGAEISIALKNGGTVSGVLEERNQKSVTVVTVAGGLRIVLDRNEILPAQSHMQNLERDSATESLSDASSDEKVQPLLHDAEILTGVIKVFVPEHFWGVILSDDGNDYSFIKRNISDYELENTLSTGTASIDRIRVAFLPSVLERKDGITRPIATEIILENRLLLRTPSSNVLKSEQATEQFAEQETKSGSVNIAAVPDSITGEEFDASLPESGFTRETLNILNRLGFSLMSEVQEAFLSDPNSFFDIKNTDEKTFEEISNKVFLFMTISSLYSSTSFSSSNALKYLAANVVPQPKYDFNKQEVLIPDYREATTPTALSSSQSDEQQNPQIRNNHNSPINLELGSCPSTNGETKDIAVNVTAPFSNVSQDMTNVGNSPSSSLDGISPSIPQYLRERVYEILSREEKNRGRTLYLSEMVPLLKTQGILIDDYGYKKAKAFLLDLGFADILSAETPGSEGIVLNSAVAHVVPLEKTDETLTPPSSIDRKEHVSLSTPLKETTNTSNSAENDNATAIDKKAGSNVKALLSTDAQIAYMESKGVRFNAMTKTEAKYYLCKTANYFRLRAFRGGFERFAYGNSFDTYKNLDFAWLVDLAVIDDAFRAIMRNLTSDIEQAARLRILQEIETREVEPYGIVRAFLQSEKGEVTLDSLNKKRELLAKGKLDPYIAGLVKRYGHNNGYPIWAFLELITFGSLCWFYGFVSDLYESEEESMRNRKLNQDRHVLQVVKLLRNACSHGNCILNCLSTAGNDDPYYRCEINWDIKAFVKEIDEISDLALKRYLYDRRIYSIVATLYAHRFYVERDPYLRACKQLGALLDQIAEYRGYCDNGNNPAVFHALVFLENVIKASHGITNNRG